MLRRYYLRHRDTIIGYFSADGTKYTPIDFYENRDRRMFPAGLYDWKMVNGELRVTSGRIPTKDRIDLWLSERVFPEGRQDKDNLLKTLGLDVYDPWEIAVKTRGVSHADFYWFSENPEDKFSEIHPSSVFLEEALATRLSDEDFDWGDDEDPDESLGTWDSTELIYSNYFGKGD